MILTSVGVMLLCGGALAAYTVPQGQVPMSDLTVANIEAMAVSEQDGVGPYITVFRFSVIYRYNKSFGFS